ncbi:MAG TPA: response regulator transcription factor [bacterium]
MPAIRALLVDDHRVVGEAIARLLHDPPDVEVIGQATSGPEALQLVRRLQPTVVLMDIGLPGMDGVETTWTLRRQFPTIPVLILSMFEQEAYVREAFRAGACGYLVKTAPAAELLAAIRAVHAGEPIIPSRTLSPAVPERSGPPAVSGGGPGFSRREIQVLQLIVGGADVPAAAGHLRLSPHTIRNHLKSIYRKLGVGGRVEAAVHAVRLGVVKV